MAYTIPPNNLIAGQTGHVGHSNNVSDVLTGFGAGFSVLNTAYGTADPTGGADSTAAIQAAMNAAAPGYAVVPAGTFKCNAAKLTVPPSGGGLVGMGWGSNLRFDGSLNPTLFGMADTTQRRFNMRWLRITQTNASSLGTAVDASYFIDSALEHLLIDGATAAPNVGVSFNAAGTFYNLLADCRINVAGTNAIGVRLDTGANSNVVRNVHVLASASDASNTGFYVNAKSNTLDHVDVESIAGVGIDVGASGVACTILAPYLENCAVANVRFASGVLAPTVIGGTVENDTADSPNIVDNGAVSPIILNARTSRGGDIYAHSQALTDGAFAPEDGGLIAWSADPVQATAGTAALTSTTIYLTRVPIRRYVQVAKLAVYITTAGAGLTANQNFLGLYDSAGTRVCVTAAGTMDTPFTSTGWVSGAVAAATWVHPGLYWVAVLSVGTTPPQTARLPGTAPAGANLGLSAANLRLATNGTGTSLPATITPSSNTTAGSTHPAYVGVA